jgi:cation transport ATPase
MSQVHDSSMSAPAATATPMRGATSLPWAIAGLVGSALVIVAGNVNVDHAAGEHGGLPDALGTGGVCVVVAAIVFGAVLPWLGRRSRTATVLAVLSVLTLAVFWTGLPPVLGTAAAASARLRSGRMSVAAWVGVAVAAVTVIWSLVGLFL